MTGIARWLETASLHDCSADSTVSRLEARFVCVCGPTLRRPRWARCRLARFADDALGSARQLLLRTFFASALPLAPALALLRSHYPGLGGTPRSPTENEDHYSVHDRRGGKFEHYLRGHARLGKVPDCGVGRVWNGDNSTSGADGAI